MVEGQYSSFDELKLLPGLAIQLQFHHTEEQRDKSRLLGYLKGKDILVTTPSTAAGPRSVRKGEKVNVRFFSSEVNSAVAFETVIAHVAVMPYPNLHLQYPSEMLIDEVRRAVRIELQQPALMSVQGRSLPVTIVDLSAAGCRVESHQAFGEVGDEIVVSAKLEAAGVSRVLKIAGKIMATLDNFKLQDSERAYGLQFSDMSEIDRLLLHAFVYARVR